MMKNYIPLYRNPQLKIEKYNNNNNNNDWDSSIIMMIMKTATGSPQDD